MKKILVISIVIMLLYSLTGCGSKIQLPDDPIVYQQNSNDKYTYLEYDGKIYVPYCPYEEKYLGNCIGYYDIPAGEYTEAGRAYVCELKGYLSDEWIIEFLDTNCSEGMILREVNTTEIPEGFTSEYEWN